MVQRPHSRSTKRQGSRSPVGTQPPVHTGRELPEESGGGRRGADCSGGGREVESQRQSLRDVKRRVFSVYGSLLTEEELARVGKGDVPNGRTQLD